MHIESLTFALFCHVFIPTNHKILIYFFCYLLFARLEYDFVRQSKSDPL